MWALSRSVGAPYRNHFSLFWLWKRLLSLELQELKEIIIGLSTYKAETHIPANMVFLHFFILMQL